MITGGWWQLTVWMGRPFSQDPRKARIVLMKMVSFTNYTRKFGFRRSNVQIFTRWFMVDPLLNWLILLLLLPSLLLLSHLITSITIFTKRRGRRGGETNEEEGEGSTLVSNRCWFDCRGITVFWTTEVEKIHTGRPIVIPGRDNVATYGEPIFPQEENGLWFPSRGIPLLVDSIIST